MRTDTFYRVGAANFLTPESAHAEQLRLIAEHNLEVAVYKVERDFVGEDFVGERITEI